VARNIYTGTGVGSILGRGVHMSLLSLHHYASCPFLFDTHPLTIYLAGLIFSLLGETNNKAVRIYQISYVSGVTLGGILYFCINKIYPPKGLGIAEDFCGVVEVGSAPCTASPSRSVTPVKLDVLSDSHDREIPHV